MRHHLRISGAHWNTLRAHLFPGDGLESVALLLCGLHRGENITALCVRQILTIPDHACSIRRPDLLQWPTRLGLPLFEAAMREDCAIVKIHSHPGGFAEFSRPDDRSDTELFEALSGWTNGVVPHGSAVMLPGGKIFGRVVGLAGDFLPLDRVAIAGSDVDFFDRDRVIATSEADLRNVQAFGPGTVRILKSLRIGVVGCSGTGSWVVEMLARLGVGGLLLVDPDLIQAKNLNRIINSTQADADAERPKVEVLKRAVEAMGYGTVVHAIHRDLRHQSVIKLLADCDVLFGCLDSADGRDLLNRIATFFCLPYFDVGVRLDADKKGGIDYVGGGCHYLQPGESSLLNRGVISVDAINADSLFRSDPIEYEKQRRVGYRRNIHVDSPAVCSVNGLYASLAVNDFLARVHPFRYESNDDVDAVLLNFSGGYAESRSFPVACPFLSRRVGLGDRSPLLDLVWPST